MYRLSFCRNGEEYTHGWAETALVAEWWRKEATSGNYFVRVFFHPGGKNDGN